MAQGKFETKLERFVINHYDAIGFVNSLVFLVGLVVSLLIGSPATLGAFTALTVGCTIAAMVLVGRPARKRMKAWRISQKQREENEQLNQVFIIAEK